MLFIVTVYVRLSLMNCQKADVFVDLFNGMFPALATALKSSHTKNTKKKRKDVKRAQARDEGLIGAQQVTTHTFHAGQRVAVEVILTATFADIMWQVWNTLAV